MTASLSITQWKAACHCPAAWHAEHVAKTWQPPPKECYATGSLLHAAMLTPERIPAVYAEYPQFLLLTKASKNGAAGDPNGDALDVLRDAEYARSLPEVQDWLCGAVCEEEVFFELDGVAWSAHIDLHNDGNVLDLKSCKSVSERIWSPARRKRVIWHEARLYWHQVATYQKAKGFKGNGVGLLAIQHRPKRVPIVRFIAPVDAHYTVIEGYAADVEHSMRHAWTSPATGVKLPPFADMLDPAKTDLPRCEAEECEYCVSTGNGRMYPHAFECDAGV